jgi:hypothetical protein
MRVVKQTIAHHRRLPFSADEYRIPCRCLESSAGVPSGPASSPVYDLASVSQASYRPSRAD